MPHGAAEMPLNTALCPVCHGPLVVTDTMPRGPFHATERYGSESSPRETVLYGACAACSRLVVDVAAMLDMVESEREDLFAAIDHARRARALFDRGFGDPSAAMTELGRAFHGLRAKDPPGLSPWDPVSLLDWVQHGDASSYTRLCAHFVLSVWNSGDTEGELGPFNAMRALAGWDRVHRAAFIEWARDPWWP